MDESFSSIVDCCRFSSAWIVGSMFGIKHRRGMWLLSFELRLRREKRKKHWQTRFRLRQRCQLRMITSVKSRLLILESPWQESISWNRENNNLLLSILRTAANNKLKRISFIQGLYSKDAYPETSIDPNFSKWCDRVKINKKSASIFPHCFAFKYWIK